MKISTKGRYALRLIIELAERKEDGYISLKNIAVNQNISKKYLEQIIPVLSSSKIVVTNRGAQGGYKLAKSPDKITIGDILRLTEGSLSPVSCVDEDPVTCPRSESCPTFSVWQGLSKVINEYLDSVTIQDIVDREVKDNYVI